MLYPRDFNSELSKKPICGVLAVAMIAGVTFERATKAVKENMMPWQKRHGGKTYHEQRCNALSDFGIVFRNVPVDGRMTLRAAIDHYCEPNKTYMINTSAHVVTVRNNVVADQVEIAHINNHKAKRCFVKNITEIL